MDPKTVADAAAEAVAKIDDTQILINVYVPLLIVASTIIYYGSKRSQDMKEMETMSKNDAMMFPIVGSCVLFGLFLLFKLFAKEYLNLLFTGYFLIIGSFAVAMTILPGVQVFTGVPKPTDKPLVKYSFTIPAIPLLNPEAEKCDIELTFGDIIAYIIGFGIAIWYATSKGGDYNWLANDLLGTCFCIQAIEMMSLGTYQNGVILLTGLFFYDIFWVFGTGYFMEGDNSVMVSVAKNFDAPIKLLFPKSYPPKAGPGQFSMLGLGDIVIPGIFVALSLRYDVRQGITTKIFNWAMGGYVLGLGATVFVMHVFKAAQPALLYIVPSLIFCTMFGAKMAGKFSDLWNYSEEPEEASEEKKEN